MPSGSLTFTESLVLGVPRCQWRAVRRSAGLAIERRRRQDGEWCAVDVSALKAEVVNGTDAGKWLTKKLSE